MMTDANDRVDDARSPRFRREGRRNRLPHAPPAAAAGAVVDPPACAHRPWLRLREEDDQRMEGWMCKTALPTADIDDDFAGFDTLDDWDAYDRFTDADAAELPKPTPIDPEMEEILTRLEAEWRSRL
jgi:hypothetical protein